MARHWWMLLVPGSFECDVDKGRPVTTRNVLEHANLPLEGYFRALYAPLGGLRTRMENASLKLMKFCISMFSDKPPCMPLCFDTIEIILPEAARAFSSFLTSTTATVSLLASAVAGFFLFFSLCGRDFFLFLSLCGKGFFFSFFFFLSHLLPLLFLPLPLLFLRLFILS